MTKKGERDFTAEERWIAGDAEEREATINEYAQ